jgi:hypothetical protein
MNRHSFLTGFFLSAVLALSLLGINRAASVPTEVAKDSRRVLCVGIIGNTTNPSRDDPLVVRLCGEVGVSRSSFGETQTP